MTPLIPADAIVSGVEPGVRLGGSSSRIGLREIIEAPVPEIDRACSSVTCRGGGAPTARANAVSQTATADGSSSTTWYTPGRAVNAATVAVAASSICTHDQTHDPAPMMGISRCRTTK
jgi:hypothetical protein